MGFFWRLSRYSGVALAVSVVACGSGSTAEEPSGPTGDANATDSGPSAEGGPGPGEGGAGGDADAGKKEGGPGAIVVPEGPKIATGFYHTCAILPNGSAKCWGKNQDGQLGLGNHANRGDAPGQMGASLPAIDLGAGRTVKAIVAGYAHTCALLDDASVKCWGDNNYSQLGLGDHTSRGGGPNEMGAMLPAVALGRAAKAIVAGSRHTCALLDDGSVKCWGDNGYGELGLGDVAERGGAPGQMGAALPPLDFGPGRKAESLSGNGSSHTCAVLDDASIKCWGLNNNSELGVGDTASRGDGPGEMGAALPKLVVPTGRTVKQLSVGFVYSCALFDDATVRCWGRNDDGELGVGPSTFPVGGSVSAMMNLAPAAIGQGAKSVVTGEAHTCAVMLDDSLRCWGSNVSGQLGLGDKVGRGLDASKMGAALPAVALGPGRTVRALALGAHTCVLLDDGTVKCWGAGSDGQLGYGDKADRGTAPGDMGAALPAVSLQ
ncbi:hypothetical protein BH11MYX4_BH11MYX4_18970 [soil metagenome]